MKSKLKYIFLVCILLSAVRIHSQSMEQLIKQVRERLDQVADYEADGMMKTNVSFLKIPVSKITMYYKKPNKLRLKSANGFSFLPKGAVNINMNQLLQDDAYSIIDAGTEVWKGVTTRVAKLLPLNDEGDIVLSTLYIDPTNRVIVKSKTTTRENGSFELEMKYGKYVNMALPDKIFFTFHTKDYKLPKGITFDFDDGKKTNGTKKNPTKGTAEISINSYKLNKGISDQVFK